MADFSLSAEVRTLKGKKVSQLRNENKIPGSVYGPNVEPQKLTFDYRELEATLRNAGGTNVIDLNVDGKTIPVLAREVQRTVLKNDILHVDFLAPDMNKKIRAEVRLQIVGQSPLVVSRKGIMLTGPNTITLEMLPSNLLNTITVDISELDEIGDTIAVKDLPLRDGITVINDPEEMIVKIVQPSAARAAEMEAINTLLEGEEGEEGEEGASEGEDEE
ncbi:MAG: 50S ribosomal protein L25/general stress protein Ctc [Phototrophicaceae bacterium]